MGSRKQPRASATNEPPRQTSSRRAPSRRAPSRRTPSRRAPSLAAALVCFAASGASGLVYQVVWMRELTLVFGATTLAVSTVLAVFMGGLATGSLYGGALADRVARPLRTYGLVEIGIAIYGAIAPLLFDLLPSLYQPLWRSAGLSFFALSLVRFALAAVVLALPTFLMGATLPILSRYVATELEAVGRDVGRLYTINTAGAVVGAASAGLMLIPWLGMAATTLVAASLNLVAGVVALVAARDEPAISRGEEAEGDAPAIGRRARSALYVAFALSGLAALVYEVAWTRALALVLGSSVYAFTIMLTTFLVGLAGGAGVGAAIADRTRRPLAALAALEAAIAVAAFAGLFLISELPYTFLFFYRAFEGSPAALLLGTRLVVAAIVMLAPTILLGAIFPLAVRAAAGRPDAIGSAVGRLYAVNTLGAIVGAFATGFLLIPTLGVEGSLVAAVVVNLAAAAVLALASRIPRAWRFAATAAAVVVAILFVPFRPHWDPAVMATGVYRYAPSIRAATRAEFYRTYVPQQEGEVLYARDGVSATVTVQKQYGHLVLKVNGKPDATTAGDLPTQALIAHLPLLAHAGPKNALVIGWGSGVSVGAALSHPLERVTAVELEPAVVEGSHFFDEVNGKPLEDPRTELLLNDGRNVLAATDRRFDVIISEPSNPWLTGVANLFTREYFEAGAAHLAPGGVFSQWLQIYEMRPEEVASLVATFSHAFPTVYVFRGASGDLMLLGSLEPLAFDVAALDARMREPKVAENLRAVGAATPAALLSRLYLTPPAVVELAEGAPLNTDDNALIEFRAPLRVGMRGEATQDENIAALERHATPIAPYVAGATAPLLADMALNAITREETPRAEAFVTESLSIAETVRAHSVLGELRAAAGREEEALAEWTRAYALDANDAATNLDLGKHYFSKNNLDDALAHLERAVAAAPDSVRARHLRGLVLLSKGEASAALADLEAARADASYLEATPGLVLHYGQALRDAGRYDEALEPLERYVERVPDDPLGFFSLGQLYSILGDRTLDEGRYRQAETAFIRALTLDFTFAEAHRDLSLVYRKLGRFDEANTEFEYYERLKIYGGEGG